MAKKNNYYAYQLESGESGVCDSWKYCQAVVRGKAARFKGFQTRKEAKAWLSSGAKYSSKAKPKLQKGIYFDAGTGRGEGVELKVTDEKGKNLLAQRLVNRHEAHKPKGKDLTNNYGELLAAKFALEIALKEKIAKVFGDSRLVIEYWSKGFIKKDKLSKKTLTLSDKVKKLREEFEQDGGQLLFISGDHNPADLGFHK